MYRAVVFDLWGTLAVWPDDESRRFRRRWAERLDVSIEELDAVWYGRGRYERRETGPIATALAAVHDALGRDVGLDEIVHWRIELARRALDPVAGAVATLVELRRRGFATGLISNCTEEVALVWDDSPFGELFDATVFSATAGCMKPERRIYDVALTALAVPAFETLFVGDGANDELEGARLVGMTPVLVHPEGEAPRWEGLGNWGGLRVSSITQVLDLVS